MRCVNSLRLRSDTSIHIKRAQRPVNRFAALRRPPASLRSASGLAPRSVVALSVRFALPPLLTSGLAALGLRFGSALRGLRGAGLARGRASLPGARCGGGRCT